MRDDLESDHVPAILDTGSAYNIIARTSVKTLLGVTPEQVIEKKKTVRIAPLDGKERVLFGWEAKLRLRAFAHSSESMILEKVWLYMSEDSHPSFDILIGQVSGLEEKFFKHHNRKIKPVWELRQ